MKDMEYNNKILEYMFTHEHIWTDGLDYADRKHIDAKVERWFAYPENRVQFCNRILAGQYAIFPPHQEYQEKDGCKIETDKDGKKHYIGFRTVYANEDTDRIFLHALNNTLFEMFPDMVHPSVKSYQKGLSTGKTAKEINKYLGTIKRPDIAAVNDFTKFFDSVPIEQIDWLTHKIEERNGGKDKALDVLHNYLHCNLCYLPKEEGGALIEKFQSIKQGCACASFYADAILYDVDKAMDGFEGVKYFRYSDDTILIGENWDKALELFKKMLTDIGVTLNPKKTRFIGKDEYFKFLGWSLRGSERTISEKGLKTFKSNVFHITMNYKKPYRQVLLELMHYLYEGKYSWARAKLPIINVTEDLQTMNEWVMDCLRARACDKSRRRYTGGLGFESKKLVKGEDGKSHLRRGVVTRGTGTAVTTNRNKTEKIIKGYRSLVDMQNNLFNGSYDAVLAQAFREV